MVNRGDVIKHKAAMDTAIQVMIFTRDPSTSNYIVRGVWINMGQTQSFPIATEEYPVGIPAEFFIKPEHLSNWLKCTKPKSKFVRKEDWKPIA